MAIHRGERDRTEVYQTRLGNLTKDSQLEGTLEIIRRMTTDLNVVVALSIFRLTKAAGLISGTQAGAGHLQLYTAPTFKQK
jgi:hypothetical protein